MLNLLTQSKEFRWLKKHTELIAQQKVNNLSKELFKHSPSNATSISWDEFIEGYRVQCITEEIRLEKEITKHLAQTPSALHNRYINPNGSLTWSGTERNEISKHWGTKEALEKQLKSCREILSIQTAALERGIQSCDTALAKKSVNMFLEHAYNASIQRVRLDIAQGWISNYKQPEKSNITSPVDLEF